MRARRSPCHTAPPVSRTFASDRATRSISCSSAVTWRFDHELNVSVAARATPIELTQVLLLSATPSIIVHEPFNKSPLFQCHAHKRRADSVAKSRV
jgi:hypothetical protein